jgi:hypothetical protein
MRNLLEKTKGRLLKLAGHDRNTTLKWPDMVAALAKSEPGSPDYKSLVDEQETWKLLHKELTDYAKGNTSCPDIRAVQLRVLTHLFTVLSGLKLPE